MGEVLTPYLNDGDLQLYVGDALDVLRHLPSESVDCCVTSPPLEPYYGLRDYGVDGQIGLEDTPEAFIERLVDVFRGVRRVLADHGTLWVNLGDSYAAAGGAHGGRDDNQTGVGARRVHAEGGGDQAARKPPAGVKPKDLLMMPARLALALQADGWWLRSDIIWAKPNPMPESVTDRPTSAHEHVFLLAKSPRYWYDAEAIREAGRDWGPRDRTHSKHNGEAFRTAGQTPHRGLTDGDASAGRNARNVWTIATQPTPEAHFATFPEELVRRCLLAGCPEYVTTCDDCGLVVGYPHALRGVQPGVRAQGEAGGQDSEVLLADVLESVGGTESLFDSRLDHRREGLQADSRPGTPDGIPGGLRHGAPVGDGRGSREESDLGRGGPPSQRGQAGQPAREPHSDAEADSRSASEAADPTDHLPPLPRGDRRLGACPECGGGVSRRPGVCLDPFIGSGTVAKVARAHGRHAIGVDLNPDYLDIAARRTQQLGLLTGEAA